MGATTGRWTTLGAVPATGLATERIELHQAVQLVAAVGHSLLPARPDDSHTSLTWDDGRRAFVGETVSAARPFRAALEPARLTLHLLGADGAALATLGLPGKTAADAAGWLNAEAAKLGPESPATVTPIAFPTPIPNHAVAHGAAFGAAGGEAERREVAAYFANAAALLADEFSEEGASPVRVWPHHFDIARLLPAPGGTADASLGVGLSPGDGAGDEPYWYVNRWPHPPADRLRALPPLPGGLGRWNTEGWVGAVLPASQALAAGEDQRATALAFLRAAVNALRAL